MAALRRRMCGRVAVAWILLLSQLLHDPVRHGHAFQHVAPFSSTTTRKRSSLRSSLELGMVLGDYGASISSCYPTTRQRRRLRSRTDSLQRVHWNAFKDDDLRSLLPIRDSSPGATRLHLSKSSDDAADKDATSEAVELTAGNPALSSSDAASTNDDVDDVSSSGVTRTLLLAVPLFCKFVLVLMIKFVTDLIVYPLLLLYRSARIAKRKVLRLIYGDSNNKNSGGGGTGASSVNGAKP